MKDLAREKRIYLAIWRKAWKEQVEELVLKVPSYSLALTIRMTMYRTIQPYRTGKLHDAVLAAVAEKYVLTLQKEPPAIRITLRKTAEAAEVMFADLGLDEMDLMSEEESSAYNSITSNLTATSHQSNPFFNRDDS